MGGGLIKLGKTEDIAAKLIMFTKKIKDLLAKRPKIVKVIDEVQEMCNICELRGHITRNCPTLSIFKEVLNEQTSAFNMIHQPTNNPYSSTYNLSWKNCSNL